jgi:hypothetical protein
MDPINLARIWRTEHGYTGKGGVIVIYDGVVNGWANELRDPNHWRPGCIAVDVTGRQWISSGGNIQQGAEHWEPVSTAASE